MNDCREEKIDTMLCYAKSLQSCPTLCDPIDGSPLGSPVPGILQARTLEWVAIAFSVEWGAIAFSVEWGAIAFSKKLTHFPPKADGNQEVFDFTLLVEKKSEF